MNSIKNLLLGTAVTLSFTGCFSSNNLINNTKDNVENIIGNKNNNLSSLTSREKQLIVNRSKVLIGKNDFDYFFDYFSIKNNDDFILKVYEIQSDNNLNIDGILGKKTLEVIYLNYYKKSKITNFNVSKRLEIYENLKGYNNYPGKYSKVGKVLPGHVPSTFDKNYFYGISNGENIENTFINKSLSPLIYDKINKGGNIAVLQHVKGKYFIAVYIDKNIKLLSYVSPGTTEVDGGIKTKKGNFKIRRSSEFHFSGAKESVYKDKNGVLRGAVMPLALHVVNGIYFHAGYVSGKRSSHGCIRLPLFYAKGFFDIFKKEGNIELYIMDN